VAVRKPSTGVRTLTRFGTLSGSRQRRLFYLA
jgi:hypothetical protein